MQTWQHNAVACKTVSRPISDQIGRGPFYLVESRLQRLTGMMVSFSAGLPSMRLSSVRQAVSASIPGLRSRAVMAGDAMEE